MKVKYPARATFSQIGIASMFSFEDCGKRYTALKTHPFYSVGGKRCSEEYNAIDVENGEFLTFNNDDSVTALDGCFVITKE